MLLSLPEELQTLVLEHLALPGCRWSVSDEWPQRDIVPEHLASLSNVCLVSRNLHRLAWPILYRAFTNAELRDRSSQPPKLEPSLFLRTICLKPEYGSTLRSLSIDLGTPIGAMHASELFELLQGDATLAALIQWKVRGFWFGTRENGVQNGSDTVSSSDADDSDSASSSDTDDEGSVSSNDTPPEDNTLSEVLRLLNMQLPEAQMAVLLLLCPKIKELHIRGGLSRGSTATALVLKSILDAAVDEKYRKTDLSQIPNDFEQEESDYTMAQMFGSSWPEQRMQKLPMLQCLEKLSIYSSIMPGRGVDSFKSLLVALPSLRTLELLQFKGEFPHSTGTLPLSACAQLDTLRLLDCGLDTSDVLEILRYCPNLTEFELDWAISWNNLKSTSTAPYNKQDWRVRLGDIVDALATGVPNLKLLKLSSAQLRNQNPSSEHPYTIGTALTQLSRLEYLKIDHSAIYGPHDSDSRSTAHRLSEFIPKGIGYLEIGCNGFSGESGEFIKPVDAWEGWQIDDLNHLLQDKSFGQLNHLNLELDEHSTRRHIHQDTMTEHGWRIFEDEPENWVFRIENPGKG
ncbi:hypothetical protein MBLNU13_g00121t1 [Cladosporium sp. NU13]